MNLKTAIQIATKAHEGQTDKAGLPYITHPTRVMEQVKHLGADYAIVAILHDVVEDSDITIWYN